jgi:serine/threonine protein kinase/Tol biopolymer transport system component
MAVEVGARLGPYEITGTLGAGGMGEVYRARDTRLKRDVAIKILPPTFAPDPEASGGSPSRLERFQGEAEVLASLNHPNIAALFGVEEFSPTTGQGADTTALIMELVEGPTLTERILQGPIPVTEVVHIARQIAEALDAAHEQGIVHRDLKPANVKVRADGMVKVLDFGLAKVFEPVKAAPMVSQTPTLTAAPKTRAGVVLGTPGYMSPEQARGKPVDKRTDIWAFGCVLFELIAGRVAFAGDTTSDMLVAVLSQEPDWSLLPEATPGPLRRLVRRCLEKDPRHRLRDIGDARIELDGASQPDRSGPPLVSGLSRRRALMSGAALGLLGLGGGVGAFVWGRARRSSPPSYHRLTYRRGLIRTARFAPDYQTVLYGALWEGDVCRVYSVRPESPESAPLNLPPATPLAVSSSGELALALGSHFRGVMTYGTLARVPLAGGAPREMLEATKFADWAPDGRNLAVVRRAGNREQLEFPIGNVLAETSAPASGFSFPRVSPGGDRIAFFELSASLVGRLAVADRRGTKTFASPPYRNVFGLAWKGDEIWFTAADERPLFRNVIFAVTPGGEPRVLSRIPGNASLHDVTPDGRVLMARTDDRGGIAVLAPGRTAEEDLSWHDSSSVAALSADGQTLLFNESGVGGGGSVYLRSTSGSAAVRLGDGAGLALSPDGKWALARRPGPSSPYLDLLPTGPGQSRRIEHPATTYFSARWTRQNARVAVRAQKGDEPPGIHLLDLEKNTLSRVTPTDSAADAGWAVSPDGATVAVAFESGVFLYPLAGGDGRPAAGLTGRQLIVGWTGEGLLVSENLMPQAVGRIFRVDLATGRRTLWRELVPRDPSGIMNVVAPVVTPDGRAYAYGWFRATSDLYLIDGLA